MACFWKFQQETKIAIPAIEELCNITFYKIAVTINNVEWSVTRRYSDFFELHNTLVVVHGVSKDILPPKKVIGNKDPLFIEMRRKGLEKYLNQILCYFKRTMPKLFTDFLNFHVYDIFFLLQNLAFQISNDTTSFSQTKSYTFNPLQLHAICESLRNPFPGFERLESQYDICHVLDFCSDLQELNLSGISTYYLNSNIIPNNLPFDFTAFKSLKVLKIQDLTMENIHSIDMVRRSVESLIVNKCSISSVSQVLQCDVLHKSSLEDTHIWSALTKLDLTCNNLTSIDDSMKLLPKLTKLNLSQNKLSTVNDLSYLTQLIYLCISNNCITTCVKLHEKLGNILTLDLSQNSISSLSGFQKLYSLQNLDISFNEIADVEEVAYLNGLPCLQNLILTGNPVATTVDYRIKTYEYFGNSAKQICLDNEKPTQAELDKVQLLIALRIVKEGKIPDLQKKHIVL